jgi:hypothetical protein
MAQRLRTALIVGGLAALVGVGVAIYLRQQDQMLGIALVTGLVGFGLGLVFKFRVV